MLVLIRGLPGSGKSTIAKAMTGFKHCEADSYFVDKNGDYLFDRSKISEAHKNCQMECALYLAAGWDVVVSNTFTQMWEMQPYFDMVAPEKPTVIEAKGCFKNVHGVPEESIERMRARWEEI